MTRIYSHPNMAMVHLARNQLENRGIASVIQGEHAAAVVGGGAGIDAWNELWIVDAARAAEAADVLRHLIEEPAAEAVAPWTCPRCGETVEATFGVCWHCGEAHPE